MLAVPLVEVETPATKMSDAESENEGALSSSTWSSPSSSSPSSPSSSATTGLLLAIAGVPLVLRGPLPVVDIAWVSEPWFAGLGCLLLVISALVVLRSPRLGSVFACLPVLTTYLALLPTWASRPAATLASLVLLLLGARLLFVGGGRTDLSTREHFLGGTGHLRGTVLGALGCWSIWIANDAPRSTFLMAPVLWAATVSLSFGAYRLIRRLRSQPKRSSVLLLLYVLTPVLAYLFRREAFWAPTLPVALAVATGLSSRRAKTSIMGQDSWWEPLLGHPERLLVGTFAGLSLLGGVALSIPISTNRDVPLSGLDALFTSTSAVCVTGLITVDTPVDLSPFGQAVVLLLIQIGGLGIMTFSTAILWAVGGRMSLRHEGAVASLISTHDRGRLFDTARKIVLLTVAAETLGALLLTVLFLRAGDSFGQALWRGVFTSISAFCNAGFALQTDSLIPYQSDPLVLHTVGVLIILGGLSPLAIFALVPLIQRSVLPVPAQAKLCLIAAALLLVGGFLFILGFEWNASLRGLSAWDKVHNAWFQSVTLRTAGFNSVDLSLIEPATFVLVLIWMFIGGSPGGTAGGVKTTTIAILVLSVFQSIRGRTSLEVFGKHIPEKSRARATAVVAIAASVTTIALVFVLLTQAMPERTAVFEVFSALGTVGLSIGGTAELDGTGKLIIIFCMFVGRVGGLSLLMFLSARRFIPRVGRPVEEVDVG